MIFFWNLNSYRDLQKTVVQVNVGQDTDHAEETFTIHKELICYYSRFFKAALEGSWTEAETGVVKLPLDSPVVFETFQAWLYSQNLELDEAQESDVLFLMKLQVFGDKVQVPEFQNAALDALRLLKLNSKPFQPLFKPSEIAYACQNMSADSPLRKLLTDLYVWEAYMPTFIDNFAQGSYPLDFVLDVTKGYVIQFPRPKKASAPKPYIATPGHYFMPSQLNS